MPILEQTVAWRNLLLQKDLLRPILNNCPSIGKGISLAYLEALAASLADVGRSSSSMPMSTGELWIQFVMPALARLSEKNR